ncbi:MAG: hypothetical protein IIA14_13320 [SAR324 cluster bacterium]|nr:hypothetical protein [SAR324 cluster bacterium]
MGLIPAGATLAHGFPALPLREIALEFVSHFCRPDLAALANLLDEPFPFQGPLLEAASREDCLAGLRVDPPEPCAFTVLAALEDETKGARFWHDHRPDATFPMAEWFGFRREKNAEILLIFDSGPFA